MANEMIFDDSRQRFVDTEWETAEKSDEKHVYYRCKMFNGGTCIRRYKPSIAKIVAKRTGLSLVPISCQ